MRNLRSRIFFIIDLIRGGLVKDFLSDIENHLNRGKLPYSRLDLLSNILEYARKNVKYYNGVKGDLESFPVIDKGMIRANCDDFISNGSEQKNMKKVVTSGSTGFPFQVFHDDIKRKRNSADTIYFGKLGNFNFGRPLAYLKIWNEINVKSPILKRIENIYPVNVINLSDSEILNMLNYLNKSCNILSFLGYVSALENIGRYIKKNNFELKFNVKSVITMSEGLDAEGRKLISSAFKCNKVYSRYSNVENGILAQQVEINSPYFLINTASYVVEILNDYDLPEEDGKLGKIVVTDLFSYGMPMIRYDTGDIGAVETKLLNGQDRRVLTKIEGRKMDAIFNTKGELISSFNITNGMWKYTELLQYQFIQKTEKSYLFKLNVPEGFKREKELLGDYKLILGEDAQIVVNYVVEIPLLSSGKRKKVINQINQ
jgi:phenylacetate-CoA ligase